jgi:hypothetical protein
MKKIFLLGTLFALLCAGCVTQSGSGTPQAAPEGYVKLAVTGTDVNLRPLPQAGGSVVAQANTGDIFIAEQWPIKNTDDESEWYRIVFAVKADGGIVPLASANNRFKTGFFPFVSAKYAAISPITPQEDIAIRKIPYRKGFSYDLGNNLPDIVRTFGLGEITREFSRKEIEYFGIDNTLFARINLPGLPDTFLWESLDTPYDIHAKQLTLTKPGFVFNGIAIATPGFGKEQVRKLMKTQGNIKPEISKHEDGERWYYGAEMWNCEFIFDAQGLVKLYQYYYTTG